MPWVAAVATAAAVLVAAATARPLVARPVAADSRCVADCDEPRSLLQVQVSVAPAGARRRGAGAWAEEAPTADELSEASRGGSFAELEEAVVPPLPPASVQDADYVRDSHGDLRVVPMAVIHYATRQIAKAQRRLEGAREQARRILRNSSELEAALEVERASAAAANASAAGARARADAATPQFAQLHGTMRRASQLRTQAERAAHSLMRSRNRTISIRWEHRPPTGTVLLSNGSSASNATNLSTSNAANVSTSKAANVSTSSATNVSTGSGGSSPCQTVSGTVDTTWDHIAPLRDELEGRLLDLLALAREAGELEDATQQALVAVGVDQQRSKDALAALERQLAAHQAAEAKLVASYTAANASTQAAIGSSTAADEALKIVNASLMKFWGTTASPPPATTQAKRTEKKEASVWMKVLTVLGALIVALLLALLMKLARG